MSSPTSPSTTYSNDIFAFLKANESENLFAISKDLNRRRRKRSSEALTPDVTTAIDLELSDNDPKKPLITHLCKELNVSRHHVNSYIKLKGLKTSVSLGYSEFEDEFMVSVKTKTIC